MDFHKRNQGEALKSVKFKRSILAMCVMALSAPSFAQEPQQEEAIEEVLITGQRVNLENAQETKRNASTVVDSISAEDIGSLPDRSVLEAMQRIPGISIERFAAANDPDHFGVEGSGATIRGMSATRSEFNGRDSFTANSGRGLSFQDVPPELMSGVDVYKNQTADMIEGGIGGTVSLRTRKPFDQPGRKIAFTADVSTGDLAEKASPTGSLLFSDRLETDAGEFGVLVNLSHSKLYGQSNGIQSDAYVQYMDDYTGYPRTLKINPAGPSDIVGAEAFAGGTVWMPNGSNLTMKDDDRTRNGYYADIQWESTDQTLSNNFQALRSDANLAWTEHAVKYQSGYDIRQAIPLEGTQYAFDSRGLFQSGTITNDGRFSDGGWRSGTNKNGVYVPSGAAVPQFGNRFQTDVRVKDSSTVIDDFSNTFKWSPNEKWDFSLDLQYIRASTKDNDVQVMLATHAVQQYDVSGSAPKLTLIEPWHGLRDNNVGGIYGVAGANQLTGAKRLPGFSDDPAGDSNWFQDPTSYHWQSIMDHYERSEGTSKAARFDTTYHFDDDTTFLRSVKAGVRYADREQTVRFTDYGSAWGALAPLWSSDEVGWLDAGIAEKASDQVESVDWSNFFRGDGTLNVPGDRILHPSADLARSIVRGNRNVPIGKTDNPWKGVDGRSDVTPGSVFRPSEVFFTEEENKSVYVRFDFESEIADRPLKGNFGLRYVELTRIADGSVKYPDLIPKTPVPAGAPDPRNKEAHLAYLNEKRTEYVNAAIAADPDFTSKRDAEVADAELAAKTTNPNITEDELAPVRIRAAANYENEQIKKPFDDFFKYANDSSNFLSDAELGFGNNLQTVENAESSYSRVLPSLNLAYSINDDLIARLAISKALASPDMENVRNTTTLGSESVSRTIEDLDSPPMSTLTGARVTGWNGSAGNPYLLPMQSNQIDAALEWYFAKGSSITFTVFRKDLSDFWVNGAFDRVYTNPTSGVTQTAQVTGTVNSGEGMLQGFEFAYQQFFDMLPAPFDGVGVQFNYSYIESESLPNAGDLSTTTNADTSTDTGARVDLSGLPLQGQSKNTFNAALMYEKDSWSARLAYNWRSRYLLTTRDVISRYPLWNDAAGFLDGSVSYKINDNFTVGLQFTNILNTQTKTIMILDGKGLEAGRSWFENDRRAALTLKGSF